MTTIFERVATALSTLTPTPYGAGAYLSASPESIPDTYMSYQVISAPPAQHADDSETLRTYRVQVSAFSRAGMVNLPAVETAMKAGGFVYAGQRQLNYDERTRHYGVAYDFTFLDVL